MLSIFKKLFCKPEPKAVAAPAAPAAPLPTSTSIPTIEVAHLSLAAVVARFPDDLKPLVTGTPDPAATVALPIPTILKQLPTGTVKMSLASLHRQAHGLIKPLPPGDKRSIEIPLSEVFRHVRMELLRRRPDQRRLEVPENGFNLFSDSSNPHLIAPDDVADEPEHEAEPEPHVLDLTLDLPQFPADEIRVDAPRLLKMDDGLKAHFGNGKNSHPAESEDEIEAQETVQIAEPPALAARAERPRVLAPPPEFAPPPRIILPAMPTAAPVSGEPEPSPALELSLEPHPVAEIESAASSVAEHVVTLELEPEPEPEPQLQPEQPQPPEASAPSGTAETLAPTEPLPTGEPTAATTEPLPVAESLPQHEESQPAQAEPQPTPEKPIAIQPTEPAHPIAAPEMAAPAPAVARPEGLTLSLPIASLAANWPDEIRAEIGALDPATTVALPVNVVTAGLAKGRVAFAWKEIHSWLEPQRSTPSAVAGETVLQLPLKVVAPAFLKSKKPAAGRKTIDMDETIPALFNGGQTPEAAPVGPATEEPAAEAAPEQPPVEPDKLPETVGEVFGQPQKESWTPAEIVSGTVTLPGVAGAVLALQEGLVVASSLPQGVKSEVVAAFLPQIFARLNQYAGEMRLGEVDDLLFTTHGAHCQIYRLGYIYFGVLGKEGASLPWHELRLICDELARQTHR